MTTTLEPFVFSEGGRLTGFYWEIWEATAIAMDVEYEVEVVDTFADVLRALVEDEADVGVAPIAPTANRSLFMDFSVGIIQSGAQIGVSPNLVRETSLLESFLSPTLARILGIAFVVLVVVSHLIWLIERRRPDSEFRRGYFRGVWDAFWWACVTVTTVGYGDKKPLRFLGRVVALTWMLFGLFFVSAFVAQVTSQLTVDRLEASVQSLDDLYGEKVAVLAGTTFERELKANNIETVPVESQRALFAALTSGDANAVVTNPYSLQFFAEGAARGVVRPVGEVFIDETETFGLAQGSSLREPLNAALLQLEERGITDAILARWFPARGS